MVGRLEPVRAHGNVSRHRRVILGVLFWPAALASPHRRALCKNSAKTANSLKVFKRVQRSAKQRQDAALQAMLRSL